jgi:tetratricopeptide repeat protein/zinc ribbon protein
MICTYCHTPNSQEDRFCRECGSRLEAQAEATVLPVWAVDYGAGGAGDEEQIDRLVGRALSLLDGGNAEEALATAHAALALAPESAAAHSVLGLIYEGQGRTEQAIRQFERALQIDPGRTADRGRLVRLRPHGDGSGHRPRLRPAQVAAASAAVSGVLVFGVGLALMGSGSTKTGRKHQARPGGGPAAAQRSPLPSAAPHAVLPRLTPPVQAVPAQGLPASTRAGLPAPFYPLTEGSAFGPATSPVLPATGRRSRPPALPPARGILPAAAARQKSAGTGMGLQAAAVRRVAPLELPDAGGGDPGRNGAEPAHGQTGERVESNSLKGEPLERDGGFIRIEGDAAPASGSAKPAGAPADRTAIRPSISIEITSGPGEKR